jgi:mRNA interferase YafQ
MRIMINISSHFKQSLKKLARRNPEMIAPLMESIILFTIQSNHPSLQTHKLSGELSDAWAFKVACDLRVLFKYAANGDIVLIDIGTHDEVY